MSRLTPGGKSSAALSKELSDFLIELAIGLHKNAIYPPGHPLLEGVTDRVTRRVESLLQDRVSLSLGVASHQLVIEGVATDEHNPVLRDLARRLHDHHIGAVKFTQGVTADEIAGVLATVVVDRRRRPKPLGLEGPEVLGQWPHVRLLRLTFEELQLLDEDSGAAEGPEATAGRIRESQPAQLWIGLARAALAADANDEGAHVSESTAPVMVAKAIEQHKRDTAYDQVVVGYLLQIAKELKTQGGKDGQALQQRVSRLMASLRPQALERLLEMGGDSRQRKKFMVDASQGMAVDAVVELVQAAASASGQDVSHSLVRLLSKLAVHAGEGSARTRSHADGALRDQVQQLISGWQLEDPNPDGYRVALEKMSRAAPASRPSDDALPCEPERLLEMGIEIEIYGEPVWRSASTLASRQDLAPLLDLLDAAPEGWLREALWRQVATAGRLHQELDHEPVNLAVVQRLVGRMGLAAADPLLDALESAVDRTTSPYIDMLSAIGAEVGPRVTSRIASARWGVQRLLLAVLGKIGALPDGFGLWEFARHPDGSVRREALRMLIRAPATRVTAIAAALADLDDRLVRMALGAAMINCPPEAAAILMARASDPLLPADLRALGIRALSSNRSPDTIAFLVRRTLGAKRFLRARALAAKTPEMLASLAGIVTHWSDDEHATQVLVLAGRSTDREIADIMSRRLGAS